MSILYAFVRSVWLVLALLVPAWIFIWRDGGWVGYWGILIGLSFPTRAIASNGVCF